MAKGKKEKEESIKLDMSFEDAMRLAMNTSPAYMITLNINEKTELAKVSGRIIELLNIKSDDINARLGDFHIIAEIRSDDKPGVTNSKPFNAMISRYQRNQNEAFFNLFGVDSRIVVNDRERLFLTLTPRPNITTTVKSCNLTYLSHTNF